MGNVCECWDRDTDDSYNVEKKTRFARTPRLEGDHGSRRSRFTSPFDDDNDSPVSKFSRISVCSGKSQRSVFSQRMLGLPNMESVKSIRNQTLMLEKYSATPREETESIYDNADLYVSLLKEVSEEHPLHCKIEVQDSKLVGCGHYGFILKAKKKRDNSDVVVKLLGSRWEDVAMNEWILAAKVGEHPNIISYIDVFYFKDTHHAISRILKDAQSKNMLGPQQKRTSFPDRYFCLIEEYMNRGTLQDWINNSLLLPAAMLMTMQSLASALAYLHEHGVGHNDIKPENVLLSQNSPDDEEVIIKLADLGLAGESTNFVKDSEMFGMTVYCMIVGETYGQTKFDRIKVDSLISEVVDDLDLVQDTSQSRVLTACTELPNILRRIWLGAPMTEIRDWPCLQGWKFLENTEESAPSSLMSRAPSTPMCSTPSAAQIKVLHQLAENGYAARACAVSDSIDFAAIDLEKRKSIRKLRSDS